MELVHGNIDNAERYVEEVFDNVHNNNDKIQAYSSKIYLMGVIGQQNEAVDLGVHVLKKLGITFPIRHCMVRMKHEMKYIKRLLKRVTGSGCISRNNDLPSKLIRRLEFMTMDEHNLKCMQILKLLMTQSILVRPNFAPFVVLKLMKLTLLYGLNIYTSIAFSCYGAMCVVVGDIEEGYRFGMLAIELLDRFQVKHYIPRVYSTVYGGIFIWKRPFRDSVKSFIVAYNIGLQTGDIEYAMINAYKYCDLLLDMGTTKLDVLANQIREYCKTVEAYNAKTPLLFMQPLLLALYHLIGKGKLADSSLNDDISSVKSGESTSSSSKETNSTSICDNKCKNDAPDKFAKHDDLHDDFQKALQRAREAKNPSIIVLLNLYRMITAYYFRDYKFALSILNEFRKGPKMPGRNPPGVSVINAIFHITLIILDLAREHKRNKNFIKYKKIMFIVKHIKIRKFSYWTSLCPENFCQKLYVLQAEYSSVVAYLSRNQKVAYTHNNRAYEKYFAANSIATNCNNYAAQALIHERLGYHYYYNLTDSASITLNATNDGISEVVVPYFRKAMSYYDEWGAKAKSQHLQEEMISMFGERIATTDPATATNNNAGSM